MGSPWYKWAHRWCQTNLTEIDARDCDVSWWREYWRQNHIQGIIVNAGGIVAYYPSKNPLQYRSPYLGGRDLLREFIDAAREEGIAVLARMDINRATKEFYEAHPDWFAVDADGKPYRAGERYVSCLNSTYYKEYIPDQLREIIADYRPDGITDNSWSGATAKQICYCAACRDSFREFSGGDLPAAVDWEDRAYRLWIEWGVKCRRENWALYNRITTEAGGQDCLWMGMLNANPMAHGALVDMVAFGDGAKAMMCDHQSREEIGGFEQNSLNGLLLHSVSGGDAMIAESMANYNRGRYFIRRSANPPEETRTWIRQGIAGGLSPWTHFIGAAQEDRRIFDTCAPEMQWHREQEQYLYNRAPVANVGLVWSHENIRFYGKNDPVSFCELPWAGFHKALIRARIPFVPVNSHHIERDMERLDVLVLPDIAVFTDGQMRQLERFVKAGKSLVLTGATGMLDEYGYMRKEDALTELIGIERMNREILTPALRDFRISGIDNYELHNYARIESAGHPIFAGIGDTDIMTLSGHVYEVRACGEMETVATYIPPFPAYPPEFAYMDDAGKKTEQPVILAGTTPFGGRVVYLAADVDRRYAHGAIPDHGTLLANSIRWVSNGNELLRVKGNGYLDCKLYRQEHAFILHIGNLSGLNQWPGYVEELYPTGPLCINIRSEDFVPGSVECKVLGKDLPYEYSGGWISFTLPCVESHELVVVKRSLY